MATKNCPNNFSLINAYSRKTLAHEAHLRAEGHTCIKYKGAIPLQIKWCHLTPCIKSGREELLDKKGQ